MYLYNSPDFLFMWMGLLSIGAAPALINYNLASEALVHCIRISGAKILIYDSAEDCVARISGSQQQLGGLSIDTIRLTDDFRWEISQFPETRPIVDAFENATGLFSVGLFYTRYALLLHRKSYLTFLAELLDYQKHSLSTPTAAILPPLLRRSHLDRYLDLGVIEAITACRFITVPVASVS